MPIVKNNYWETTRGHEDYNIGVANAHEIKVNMTLDVLDGCIHNCAGCFVNRRRQQVTNEDIQKVLDAQELFMANNIRFTSINIGPTDVFGNLNILDLLDYENFRTLVSRCTTIEMPSTLQAEDKYIDQVIEKFNSIPKRDDFLYGFQVVIDPKQVLDPTYRKNNIARIHEVLNKFTDPLDYYITFNIDRNIENLAEISRIVRDEYESILETLPSYQRYSKGVIHERLINDWVKTIENTFNDTNKEYLAMTIADKDQGGPFELNYTFSGGEFYSTPFVYEAALIKTDEFRVQDPTDIKSWTDLKTTLYLEQLDYLSETTSCENCSRREICMSKHVLKYMEYYRFKDCVYPLRVLESYNAT